MIIDRHAIKLFLFALVIVLGIGALVLFQKNGAHNEPTGQENPVSGSRPVTEVFPPSDQDGDGLSDEQEQAGGSDPTLFDSDEDGLSDLLEIQIYKTDPAKPDTDGDGYWDAEEIEKGFDPRKK